tara:strand:+ start:1640 stop:1969 length:330 start_codon:yes stop_codon:yes gene_type:complete
MGNTLESRPNMKAVVITSLLSWCQQMIYFVLFQKGIFVKFFPRSHYSSLQVTFAFKMVTYFALCISRVIIKKAFKVMGVNIDIPPFHKFTKNEWIGYTFGAVLGMIVTI